MGLSLFADEPSALVFDANGVMLRVAKVQALDPAHHTVLGWRVSEGIWTSPSGARVAWFKDPDGNVLSLTQF